MRAFNGPVSTSFGVLESQPTSFLEWDLTIG